MKLFTLALILLGLSACSSKPKTMMKNCEKIHDDYYECEEIPQKVHRSFDRL